jgi:hypothetical protein
MTINLKLYTLYIILCEDDHFIIEKSEKSMFGVRKCNDIIT